MPALLKLPISKGLMLLVTSLLTGLLFLSFSMITSSLVTHLAYVSGGAYADSLITVMVFSALFSLFIFYNEKSLMAVVVTYTTQLLLAGCQHILSVSPDLLRTYGAGELAQRISDYENGVQNTVQAVFALVGSCGLIFGVMLYFFFNAPEMIFPVFLLIACSLSFKLLLFRWRLRLAEKQLITQTKFSSWLTEVMFQINKIRMANALPSVLHRGKIFLNKQKAKTILLACTQMAATLWDSLFSLILTLFIYHQVNLSLLPLLVMVAQLGGMLDLLSVSIMQWNQGKVSIRRFTPFLSLPPPCTQGKILSIPSEAILQFEKVSYHVPGQTKALFQNVNLTLMPHEFVAITGGSGVGKSTLLRLALGLMQPTHGRILLNQRDLHHYDLAAWRRCLGVVLQDTQLIQGSLYTNIAGHLRLSLDEVWRLAEAVGLAEDIRRMPMGLFTRLSGQASESLSGGQRQKVLLARALAKQPQYLFLDEATSALDNASQAHLQTTLASLNITRLVVAHRLSSLASADRVFKLSPDEGLRVIPDFHAQRFCSTPLSQSA